jgi:hypothetical protein
MVKVHPDTSNAFQSYAMVVDVSNSLAQKEEPKSQP